MEFRPVASPVPAFSSSVHPLLSAGSPERVIRDGQNVRDQVRRP